MLIEKRIGYIIGFKIQVFHDEFTFVLVCFSRYELVREEMIDCIECEAFGRTLKII